jgi:hypothetical protein
MDRPALKKLLDAVRARRVDVIVVYKVDRLTRSLADFAKLVELFDEHQVSFVSVTHSFNTTTSMGRLTLNVLLSFAQFEREVTGERIRDTNSTAASAMRIIQIGPPRHPLATTDSYPGKVYPGRISFISEAAEFTPKSVETHAERVTLVYRIRIDVDNPSHELVPGLPADATIPVRVPGQS